MPLLLHTAFTDKLRKVLSHPGFPPTNSRPTVFAVVELPTPSAAVLPWNLSVSKGTGLRTLFCFISQNHLSAALSGETDCPKHWLYITFTLIIIKFFFPLSPSHIFLYFFSFGFSLSGGLGEPHWGGGG